MVAFSKRLETYCKEKVANHAQRMKPNYDGQWIVSLKVKLERLDGKDLPGEGKSNSSKAKAKA